MTIEKRSWVAVAGATGYLGRHLVQVLSARGYAVRALVRPGKSFPVPGGECMEVDVTEPASLSGVFAGVSAVFSALGITRQSDKVTYEDIEYTANLNVALEAARSGVKRFGVISAVHPEYFRGLAIMKSRERFIAKLRTMGFAVTVMRGTGFFSDLKEVLDMAKAGRVYLLGDGQQQLNPVHGEDLASETVEAWLEGVAVPFQEVNVGGPDVFTWREIAELAFEKVGRPAKVSCVPLWLPRAILPVVRLVNGRAHDVGQFLVHGASGDMVAPQRGSRHLADFYARLASASEAGAS